MTGSPHLSVVFEVGVCQSRDPPLGSGSAQGKGGRNHEEERGYCHIVGKKYAVWLRAGNCVVFSLWAGLDLLMIVCRARTQPHHHTQPAALAHAQEQTSTQVSASSDDCLMMGSIHRISKDMASYNHTDRIGRRLWGYGMVPV